MAQKDEKMLLKIRNKWFCNVQLFTKFWILEISIKAFRSACPLVLQTSVEYDPVPVSQSNRLLYFRTGSGWDWIWKKTTGSVTYIQTALISVVKCLIGVFRIQTRLDQILEQVKRMRIGLDCTMKILDWIKVAKIFDPLNHSHYSYIERPWFNSDYGSKLL